MRLHRLTRRREKKWFTKADCDGCRALVDELGRYEPGFCGPLCLMRRVRDGEA